MSETILVLVTEPESYERLKSLMPVFKPAGNIKDEVKKAADVQDKERAFIDDAHKYPMTGKIAGFAWMQAEDVWGFSYAADGVTEEKLIKKIHDVIHPSPSFPIVAYDGDDFDYPFICARASKYPSHKAIMENFKFITSQPETYVSLRSMAIRLGLTGRISLTGRYNVSLKELAAFYDVPYSPAIHFQNAIADYRRYAAPPIEPTFENPSGASEMTESQKTIHGIMVKHLKDTCTTIFNIYQKIK